MAGRIPRNRIEIDRHSFIEAYPDGQSSVLVMFVHGIFGDPRGTWAETPHTLMMLPALANADWGSYGYDTGFFYRRETSQTLDQFILWMKTHSRQYSTIFFVAHDMGGLIVRDLCADLGIGGTEEDLVLLSKIRHGFLVASPVGGAVLAQKLSKIPMVNRLNSFIPYLAQSSEALI